MTLAVSWNGFVIMSEYLYGRYRYSMEERDYPVYGELFYKHLPVMMDPSLEEREFGLDSEGEFFTMVIPDSVESEDVFRSLLVGLRQMHSERMMAMRGAAEKKE